MRALVSTLVVAFALAAPSALARSASFIIQADHKIGPYSVRQDGSLRGVIASYGDPSSVRRHPRYREICHVGWSPIGLSITFYNLGGANPCAGATGRFGEATMTTTRWRTSVGLRVGDSLARLRALYRGERRRGAWWWLVTRRSPFGEGGSYPGLAARVRGGRVVSFAVRYPAGGD